MKLFLFYFCDEVCFKQKTKNYMVKKMLRSLIMILLETHRSPPSAFGSADPVTGLSETCFIFQSAAP